MPPFFCLVFFSEQPPLDLDTKRQSTERPVKNLRVPNFSHWRSLASKGKAAAPHQTKGGARCRTKRRSFPKTRRHGDGRAALFFLQLCRVVEKTRPHVQHTIWSIGGLEGNSRTRVGKGDAYARATQGRTSRCSVSTRRGTFCVQPTGYGPPRCGRKDAEKNKGKHNSN